MARLIDADELLDIYTGVPNGVYTTGHIVTAIKECKTVDAAPVKHGLWITDEDPHDGDVRCSVCRIAIDQMHERNHELLNALTGGKWYTFYSYCPRCGAKMDLEI